MDKYYQDVEHLLSKRGLTIDDCTSDEIDEMLEEARARDLISDKECILEGYFGSPLGISSIEIRKKFIEFYLKEKGLSVKDISLDDYHKLLIDFPNLYSDYERLQ